LKLSDRKTIDLPLTLLSASDCPCELIGSYPCTPKTQLHQRRGDEQSAIVNPFFESPLVVQVNRAAGPGPVQMGG